MRKLLILLATIVLAAIRVFCFAQTQPQGPPEKRVTKQSRGSSTEVTEAATQEKNGSPNVTIVVNQGNPVDQQSKTSKDSEDVRIQGKLADLTTWLVVAGLLQVVALSLTWGWIIKQTNIMKEHKISLESLATAARQNVEAASKNLEAMNRQADTMTKMLKSVGAQTGLMEKQVIAMQNQANLMQAQFDQWIDLENWTINRKMDSLVIGVDLVNHTAYPITLDEGVLIISENEGMRSMRNDFGETSLSPNQPNHIRFDFGTIIHPDELMSLPSASFKVKGMFSHRHRITNEVVRRPLEGQLQCGPWQVDRKWHIAYTPLVHPNPEPGETEGEQKAN